MIQVGFTGTRHGMTDAQKVTLETMLIQLGGAEFHHGDCIGADSEAHDIAMECGYCPIIHPPTNPALRAWRKVPAHLMRPERLYMTRNRNIVDAAKRYAQNRNTILTQSAIRRENPYQRARSLFLSAKLRSPEGFSLTLDHVQRGIDCGRCAVTGVLFDLRPFEKKRTGKRCNPFAPSIDRIDSRLPYTDENTRIVIWQFNNMKNEMSDGELVSLCRLIVEKIG